MVLSGEQRYTLLHPYVEILRDCRESSSLSQARLAGAAGLSTKYVTLVEGGKRVPSLESLLALMANAGVKRRTAEQLVRDVLNSFTWQGP
jgi:transcriptional regulator with XRE-family HTH domain